MRSDGLAGAAAAGWAWQCRRSGSRGGCAHKGVQGSRPPTLPTLPSPSPPPKHHLRVPWRRVRDGVQSSNDVRRRGPLTGPRLQALEYELAHARRALLGHPAAWQEGRRVGCEMVAARRGRQVWERSSGGCPRLRSRSCPRTGFSPEAISLGGLWRYRGHGAGGRGRALGLNRVGSGVGARLSPGASPTGTVRNPTQLRAGAPKDDAEAAGGGGRRVNGNFQLLLACLQAWLSNRQPAPPPHHHL